jgi:hypothetical protein
MKELQTIQTQLHAPKGRFNRFGGYAYRSCADILQAVKPLLERTACTLTVTDDIVEVGGRVYVRATATLTNAAGETARTTGFAREAGEKKGCDDAQLTGACSSYARKYALNGLLAIDDTKDADDEELQLTTLVRRVGACADAAELDALMKESTAFWKDVRFQTAVKARRAGLKQASQDSQAPTQTKTPHHE